MMNKYEELYEYASSLSSGWDDHPEFKSRCKQYMDDRLGIVSTDEQFETVFRYTWDEGHSSGYYNVVLVFDNILDLVEKFLKTNEMKVD